MPAETMSGVLQIIAAAVTPVVMISAAAALILGVNQKHAALSDRLRTLAMEFRAPETAPARRETIRAQVRLFARRFAYSATAHLWLHIAVVSFVGTVLVITFAARGGRWDRAGLALFALGSVLMLGAVVAELLELRLAGRTVRLEIDDVLAPTTKGSAGRR